MEGFSFFRARSDTPRPPRQTINQKTGESSFSFFSFPTFDSITARWMRTNMERDRRLHRDGCRLILNATIRLPPLHWEKEMKWTRRGEWATEEITSFRSALVKLTTRDVSRLHPHGRTRAKYDMDKMSGRNRRRWWWAYHFWEEDVDNTGNRFPDGCPSCDGGVAVAREDAQRPDVEQSRSSSSSGRFRCR